jgi:malic enzyme
MIGVKPKVKVSSKEYLGMVYTPGVAACCLAIQKDQSLALKYTNKANACIVLSDSSGFPSFDASTWVQEQTIPYLETECLFSKVFGAIDAYPILADSKLTTSAEELRELLDAISPSYCAIQLLHVSKERRDGVRESLLKKGVNSFIWTDDESHFVWVTLKQLGIDTVVGERLVRALSTRVGLDYQVFGIPSHDTIKVALEEFSKIVKADSTDLTLIEELTKSLQKAFHKGEALRNTLVFVRDNYLYGGERRVPDEHAYESYTNDENAIYIHERFKGMTQTYPKLKVGSIADFEKNFSSARLKELAGLLREDPELADMITVRKNYSAIITNGTAVLGLGDIGALAGMPVMEGKCVLFGNLGTINMMSLCIQEKNEDKFIAVVRRLSPIFTSINLEDIKAPQCFKIEETLKKQCRPAVFHDDQHGTAIVATAAMLNYAKLAKRDMGSLHVVMNGSGAAGISICKLLMNAGVGHVVVCDTKGSIYKGRKENMNPEKDWIAEHTNEKGIVGGLADVIKGADIFIGVSVAKALSKDMVRSMNKDSMVLALANPEPEIYPYEAKEAGAFVTGTGRSDFDNQVNNSLAFPGLFKSIMQHRISTITDSMKLAAAQALASLVADRDLSPEQVIPEPLSVGVPNKISEIVGECARKEGLIRPAPKTKLDQDWKGELEF